MDHGMPHLVPGTPEEEKDIDHHLTKGHLPQRYDGVIVDFHET